MISTPIYAALLALMYVALGMRVVGLRRKLATALGDADNPVLRRAIRVHANFAEYVPFALLLMYFVETRTQAGAFVHVIGIALLAGRIVHAVGVSRVEEDIRVRVLGMVLTFAAMLIAAAWLLWHAILAAML
jgi:uncharacterized membrane protein YecN with MAPEG domain